MMAKSPKKSPQDAALDAMMSLATKLGWRDLTLSDIAAEAGLSLAELNQVAGSKAGLLGQFVRRIDQAVLATGGTVDVADPVKDRLFDVAMQRFDSLQPWREAIRAIARDIAFDPVAAICLGTRRRRSMVWMLEKAGVSSAGLKGRVRAAGLDMIMLSALRVWLKDESEDMASTMAHLDRQLGRADRLVRSLQSGPFVRDNDPAEEAG
jgi:AcrR family transcriptional regulator